MSVKILDSSIYKRGLKMSLNRKHEIDTVIADPYEDLSGLSKVGWADVEDGTLVSDNSSITLPMTNTSKKAVKLVRSSSMSYMPVWGVDFEAAKGVAGIYMATKTVVVGVDEPVFNPQVVLEFEGTTRSVHKLAKSYDDFPSKTASGTDISNWINSNYTDDNSWTTNSANVDYDKDSLLVHPFIKEGKRANGNNPNNANLTDPKYITTEWTGGYPLGIANANWRGASVSTFKCNVVNGDNNTEGFLTTTWLMWPSQFYSGGNSSTTKEEQRIQYGNSHVTEAITTSIQKLTDYSYSVTIKFPVKYVYFAASRFAQQAYLWNNIIDHDNYAFMDLVTKVKVNLYAIKSVGSAGEEGYSLDNAGALTTTLVNNGIVNFEANPFIKLGTKYNYSENWVRGLAHDILTKYKDGKYTASVDVPGSYALAENIKINTEFKIKDLKGNFIRKYYGETINTVFNPSTHTSFNPGIEYVIGKELEALEIAGWLLMSPNYNSIEIKRRQSVPNGVIVETLYAYGIQLDLGDPDSPIKFFTWQDDDIVIIDSSYETSSTYITFKLLESPVTEMGMFQLAAMVSGINIDSTIYNEEGELIFAVKGIQKEYSNTGFIYRLNMIETGIEIVDVPQLIVETVTSFAKDREYWFKQPMSVSDTLTRIDLPGNFIIFRRRNNNPSNLSIIEQTPIGRIVINKSDVNYGGQATLNIYIHTSGTSYSKYLTILISDYNSGNEFWTFEKTTATAFNRYPAGGVPDILNNLGGYII